MCPIPPWALSRAERDRGTHRCPRSRAAGSDARKKHLDLPGRLGLAEGRELMPAKPGVRF